MDRVFVGYHFSEPPHDLVDIVEQILGSFGIALDTGTDLGGAELTEEIKHKIERADGFIALMTRDVEKAGGGYLPTDYVKFEFQHALASPKPCIAIIEKSVETPAWAQKYERIDYDPDAPVRGLLKVVRTIGKWQHDAGRRLHVRLEPRTIFDKFNDDAICEYRVRQDETEGPWQRGWLDPQPGDWFAYLRAQQNERFQIRLICNGQRWKSKYHTDDAVVELKEEL